MLFRLKTSLTIIWAHAGMSEPADVVEAMMARYARLFADTSFRERDILSSDDTIDPAWRKVIERFPERFMVGTDTWINSQWDAYGELIATNRQWLSKFPRRIAEQIAYRNAEKLFARKVTRKLIGKR
jgi:predicted TIM-barrel fold metal-dependent hydrolase